MRNRSARRTPFSKRESVGCEARASPAIGSRPASSCRVARGSCPPRALSRSGLGNFCHPAPPWKRLMATAPDSDRDPGTRERKLFEKISEPFPIETLALASAAEPLIPSPLRRHDDQQQTTKVPAHAEVVEVAPQASRERCMLNLYRKMSMVTTPIRDGLDRPSQARTPSLARDPPTSPTRSRPVEREPEEVEGGQTFPALLPRRRTPERQKPGLVRMQGQSEAPQPLAQHRHHTPRVFLVLEADDEVVAIPDQGRPAPQSRLHLGLEPEVQRIVQIDVAEQRREHGPLGSAGL